METSSSGAAGGYITPGLLSPPLTIASSVPAQLLPRPRSHPLNAGGSKETTFIMHVDQRLLHINRRYAKRMDDHNNDNGDAMESNQATKFSIESAGGSGYDSFAEAAKDLDSLIDIIWVSGTRK